MRRAVIFLNGNRSSRDVVFRTIKTTDTIICANGGSQHAISLGVVPQVVIGDQDSLPKSIFHVLKKYSITWITHPREKDKTDSELAIEYAVQKGFSEIIIFGALGDRIDHVLGTLFFAAQQRTSIIRILEVKQILTFLPVGKTLKLSGRKGDLVSLIPLQSDVQGVTSRGLKWELNNETLFFGKTRGVSNEFISDTALLSIKEGVLLIVQNQ
jgi:thiamine pyrophosphokinase